MAKLGMGMMRLPLLDENDVTSIDYDHHGRSIADSTFKVVKTGKKYKGKVK